MPNPLPHLQILLFTDLVASTGRFSSAVEEILQHFQSTYDALSPFGVIVTETGDGVLACFSSPILAVRAALTLTRDLRDANWNSKERFQVRIGLHVGEVLSRGERLIGDSISLAQRVMSTACGGQTLVSGAFAQLLQHEAHPDFTLVDRGLFRLKGFGELTQIFEVVTEDLPSNPLTPLSNASPPNNLPRRLTTFVGREADLEKLKQQLKHHRLVTVLGIGGGGKTRIALELGKRVLSEGREVRFAGLGVIHTPEMLVGAVATALTISGAYEIKSAEEIAGRTRERDCLLILDNAEHLCKDCARLVQTLLTKGGENLTLLVTSREALGVPGEVKWSLPTLSLPTSKTMKSGETAEIRKSEAVTLFVERMCLIHPERELTSADYSLIGEIVRRQEGLPLAIELAAAATEIYSLQELLTGDPSQMPPLPMPELDHQDTISGSIEWSLNLLPPEIRPFLLRLWVFAGGFDREAATQVVCDETLALEKIPMLLDRLVKASLLYRDTHEGVTRYHLPEAVRYYFAQGADTDTSLALLDRHLRYYRAIAEAQEPLLRGAKHPEAIATLNREQDNLHSALNRASAGEEPLRLAGALWRYWMLQGYLTLGRSLLQKVLAKAGNAAPCHKAKALNGAGVLAHRQNDYATAQQFLEESLTIFQEVSSEAGMAEVYNNLGLVREGQNKNAEARDCYERSLTLWQKLSGGWQIVQTLSNLGNLAITQENYSEAEALYRKALIEAKQIGDPSQTARLKSNLGWVLYLLKNFEAAEKYLTESMEIFRQIGNRYEEAITLNNLAETELARHNLKESRTFALESVTIALEIDDSLGVTCALNTFGRASIGTANAYALLVLSHAHTLLNALGKTSPHENYEVPLEELKNLIDPADYAALISEGEMITTENLLRRSPFDP